MKLQDLKHLMCGSGSQITTSMPEWADATYRSVAAIMAAATGMHFARHLYNQ